VALLVIGFGVYAPLLHGSFIMDDLTLIKINNPVVTGVFTPWSIWFQCDFPLSTLAFWAQWHAFGSNPLPYHLCNVCLHVLSSFLLWRLLAYLRVPGAWLAAAVLAVHPVAVASVARIAELKNTLSLPFFLMSLHCWFRYEDSSVYATSGRTTKTRSALLYTGSFLAFLFALLSKTSTTMLPLALLGFDYWRRGRLSWKDVAHTAPFFALALGFGLLSIWYQKHQALGGEAVAGLDRIQRLLLAPRTFWFYLEKAVVPVGLCAVYPKWNLEPRSFLSWFPALGIVAAASGAWVSRNKVARKAALGLGIFAVLLFPAMGLFDAQFLVMWHVSDHLQYLPLVVPIVLLISLLHFALPRSWQAPVAVLALGTLGYLSVGRAEVFTSEERLLADTLRRNPTCSAAHNDLGCLLAGKQKYPEARSHFQASLAANPQNSDAHANLGQLCQIQGNEQEAERHFVAALAAKPNNKDAHRRYGQMLARRGRHKQALIHLRAALEDRGGAETRLELSSVLYQLGDNRGAIRCLTPISKIEPANPEVLNNLAWLLATSADPGLRHGAQSVTCARHACELTGFQKAAMVGTLAAALAEAGDFAGAEAQARKAISLAQAAGDFQFANVNSRLLQVYQNRKAWHAPVTNRGS